MSGIRTTTGAQFRLAAGALVIAVTWGVILPRMLEWEPVARHVLLMEERRVDPSAMYYTELERLPLRPAWVDRVLVLWP